jgi:sigma-B regulation protein RsbU (phosphoserine phosphatase)
MYQLRIETTSAEPFDYSVEKESVIIGRAGESDLRVPDRYLSRQHARLFLDGDQLMVEDLRSRNGTTVNGRRIEDPTPVGKGDTIRMSATTISILRGGRGADPASPGTDLPQNTVLLSSADLLTQFVSADTSALRGEDDLRRHAERLSILNEVHRAVAGSIELDELLELILDRAFDHLQPEQSAIFLSGEDGEYQRVASRKVPGVEGDLHSRTLIAEVSEKNVAALVLDAQTDDRFVGAGSILDAGVRSLIAAPLSYAEGSLGMIVLSSRLHVRQFTEDDLQLLNSLASVAALRIWTLSLAEDAAERRRMEGELELARKIQIALLPEDLPVLPGYQIHAANHPSRGVSGDFYEVVTRAEGEEFVLFLADVSGKGMSASLLTATLEALAAIPIQDGEAPDEICNRLSDLLVQRTPSERFATAFLAVFEQASGEVTWASAGHNPCLHVQASGEVRRLKRTGIPLGLMSGATYTAERFRLEEGDTLIAYTDGITEAVNPEEAEYGLERFERICVAQRGESVETLANAIDDDLGEFTDGVAFADDCTLVIVRREPR